MHQFYILVGQKVQFKDNLTAISQIMKDYLPDKLMQFQSVIHVTRGGVIAIYYCWLLHMGSDSDYISIEFLVVW